MHPGTHTFAETLRHPGSPPPPPRLGLWASFLGPFALEALRGTGLDWLGLDLQHGALEPADVPGLLRVADACALPVLVRLPSHDAALLARVLDAGPAGVIVPAVESAEQAAALVRAARLPPHGRRSTGLTRAALTRGERTPPEPLLLPMVETADGLRNADAIAATTGIDGLFVGPYDLALSLGSTAADAPEVVTAVREALTAAHRNGRAGGLFAGSTALTRQLPPVALLAADTDAAALRTGVRRTLDAFRAPAGPD
ncbi:MULTISPECIES: HpcH/HpaI aldolase family protein [Streptomyces]|uniref:2,4-dihydroxyhept-2-ene-1,7-dioic acid aldolase n=1 Tax=Streptomyces cacaoi TaxID=1898 RepID=A0A4Y3QTX4_STRCI|nr:MULTISPECIES: aldolase/citrate lyase family protein [Streptomyces]NNG85294.1 aldolase [Streptomyces cacaoi]GEB48093.1 2,4-dihydroxyhept-2-ene-1,7-dioic acid aldolase [Streptomyces cacaoi]